VKIQATKAENIRVLFVAGAGRSGSTVLDTVLGAHPDAVSCGELAGVPEHGWKENAFCSCGEAASDCPFWSSVRASAEAAGFELQTYMQDQAYFEAHRIKGWRRVREDTARFARYAEGTLALLKAIGEQSGASILVDSSKNPLRAYALSRVPGVDVSLLHLVRDGRGVVWSLRKSFLKDSAAGLERSLKVRPVWRTAAFWALTNLQVERVLRSLPEDRAIRLRYEDFLNAPREALERVTRLTGLDYSNVSSDLETGKEIPVSCTIAGNRLRMSGAIRLRLDEEWKEKLSRKDLALFWPIAGTLMKRYEYPRS